MLIGALLTLLSARDLPQYEVDTALSGGWISTGVISLIKSLLWPDNAIRYQDWAGD